MRQFLTWQRNRDFLRELQFVVWTGLAGAVAVVVFGTLELFSGGPLVTTLPIMGAEDLTALGLVPQNTTGYTVTEVSVLIDRPSPEQQFLSGLTGAPSAVLILLALLLLARVIHHARRTDPFTRRTVNGLRWMGVVFFGGLLAIAVEAWAQWLLSETILRDRWGAIIDPPFAWLFAGFLCFAVAEVVQRGVLMREELEAVV